MKAKVYDNVHDCIFIKDIFSQDVKQSLRSLITSPLVQGAIRVKGHNPDMAYHRAKNNLFGQHNVMFLGISPLRNDLS